MGSTKHSPTSLVASKRPVLRSQSSIASSNGGSTNHLSEIGNDNNDNYEKTNKKGCPKNNNNNNVTTNGSSTQQRPNNNNNNNSNNNNNDNKLSTTTEDLHLLIRKNGMLLGGGILFILWIYMVIHLESSNAHNMPHNKHHMIATKNAFLGFEQKKKMNHNTKVVGSGSGSGPGGNGGNGGNGDREWKNDEGIVEIALPQGFDGLYDRARHKIQHCADIAEDGEQEEGEEDDAEIEFVKEANMTTARLPSFGIIRALEDYYVHDKGEDDDNKWQCEMPPANECSETQLTAIFMAYNPDRLNITFPQMQLMLTDDNWKTMIAEIVMVWNGPRAVGESEDGKQLLQYAKDHPDQLRIVYPLKAGLPNDLMNRYHPDIVKVSKTKGILFFDDDGPFYKYQAVLSGFELWKRNANTQIGAMSRNIILCDRQQNEKMDILSDSNNIQTTTIDHSTDIELPMKDRHFISYCPADNVEYNYNDMPDFGANMVLPSGSILHRNYLCYLWHPALEPIRQFVLDHPVHPDDMTVSFVVTQLAGRAPKVYPRRNRNRPKTKPPQKDKDKEKHGRKLRAIVDDHHDHITYEEDDTHKYYNEVNYEFDNIQYDEFLYQQHQQQQKIENEQSLHGRKLMFGLKWNDKSKKGAMTESKEAWAKLRAGAINSLVRFLGSINSGSMGWCYGIKQYHIAFDNNDKYKRVDKCNPPMAYLGTLPWLTSDHTAKESCP